MGVIFLVRIIFKVLLIIVLLYASALIGSQFLSSQARSVVLSYAEFISQNNKLEIQSIDTLEKLKLESGIELPWYNPVLLGVVNEGNNIKIYYCDYPFGPCEVYSVLTGQWEFDEI